MPALANTSSRSTRSKQPSTTSAMSTAPTLTRPSTPALPVKLTTCYDDDNPAPKRAKTDHTTSTVIPTVPTPTQPTAPVLPSPQPATNVDPVANGDDPATTQRSPAVSDESAVTVSYVPASFLPHLKRAFDYQFVRGNRFRLAAVPVKDSEWSGWRTKWLCTHRNVISVYFVCRLMSSRMYENDVSQPTSSANIHFRFIRNIDDETARHVTHKLCSPPSSSRKRTFIASCPTVKQGTSVLFTEIFDATSKFGRKCDMPKLKPTDLHTNDLLLVEARIQRYSADRDPSFSNGWLSTFYLQSITKLLSAPANAPDEAESDREDGRVDTDDEADEF